MENNAFEQTVGAKRRVEAPPAAQRQRSPDERSNHGAVRNK
jgi:hypothetical protein